MILASLKRVEANEIAKRTINFVGLPPVVGVTAGQYFTHIDCADIKRRMTAAWKNHKDFKFSKLN
jgi:hypothetical protein